MLEEYKESSDKMRRKHEVWLEEQGMRGIL